MGKVSPVHLLHQPGRHGTRGPLEKIFRFCPSDLNFAYSWLEGRFRINLESGMALNLSGLPSTQRKQVIVLHLLALRAPKEILIS